MTETPHDGPPSGRVAAVCVVHELVRVSGRVGVSAIDKRPVEGDVAVRALGLHGDLQADREHHGGEWKAVYLLSESDVEPWAEEFDGPVPPGWFGENLRVSGVDTAVWPIGTRLRIGTVELEITTPRVPCVTFGERVERRRWVKRFTEVGRPGAYARVLRPGSLRAGDHVVVLDVPTHGVTIRDVLAGVDPEGARRLLAEIDRERLAPSLLRKLDPATDVRPVDQE